MNPVYDVFRINDVNAGAYELKCSLSVDGIVSVDLVLYDLLERPNKSHCLIFPTSFGKQPRQLPDSSLSDVDWLLKKLYAIFLEHCQTKNSDI
jgi:hypothetical protein